MPNTNPPNTQTPPPHAPLIEMAMAHCVSRIAYVAAKLNLADLLSTGPKTAEELAKPTETHAPSLYRLMRTLAHFGILTEDDSHRFSLTPIGQALKSDAPGAARATILTMAGDWITQGFSQLLYSVQTGKSGLEKSLGMPVFDWLKKNPDQASLFSQSMIGVHGAEPAAVAAAYDFSNLNCIVDVGGATGNLLTTILARFPKSTGILYDLPHVVTDAPPLIAARNQTTRIKISPARKLQRPSPPTNGDAYLLSHIIHDWSEDQCLKILTNCRRSMHPKAKLLIIEMVLPPGNTPHPGKLLDMMMLVGPRGQERTEQEFTKALLSKGWPTSPRVVPHHNPPSKASSKPVFLKAHKMSKDKP